MPLANYGDLKTEVASWLVRDDVQVTSRIPDFIRMAEADIYSDLRCRHNEFTVTITTTDAPGALRSLPSNFKAVKSLSVNGVPLDPISPSEWAQRTANGETGETWAYCRTAQTLHTLPDLDNDPGTWEAGTEVVLLYYGTESLDALPPWQTPTNPVQPVGSEVDLATAVPAHGDTNTTRMFLHYPQLYLAGALMYGNAYLNAPKDEARWAGRFNAALAAVKREDAEDDLTGGENLAGLPGGA